MKGIQPWLVIESITDKYPHPSWLELLHSNDEDGEDESSADGARDENEKCYSRPRWRRDQVACLSLSSGSPNLLSSDNKDESTDMARPHGRRRRQEVKR